MTSKIFPLSRRCLLALTGVVLGTQMLTACTGTGGAFSTPQPVIAPSKTPPSFSLFYKPEHTGNIWDNWIYYHNGTFHLYYNPKPRDPDVLPSNMTHLWNGVAMATSTDGVHWTEHNMVIDPVPDLYYLGAGAVWPAGDKFIMNFSERRVLPDGSHNQDIYFAESKDLLEWQRLDSSYVFKPDPRWYERTGRWDNIWPVSRSDGGYYGYFAGLPKGGKVGVGFGESDDGVNWRALPPVLLEGVPLAGPENPIGPTPEVHAAYYRQDQYYLLLGLDGLAPFFSPESKGESAVTTMVSDSPRGPFKAAPKNHRLLATKSSYFLRFVEVNGEILANHHSWEVDAFGPLQPIDADRVWMAPLKRAQWDNEGTLRLMWWEQNNLAKGTSLPISMTESTPSEELSLFESSFEPEDTLIIEGELSLPVSKSSAPIGLYLQGSGDTGTAFLVREDGSVDYGAINSDGSGFKKTASVDRELPFGATAQFRLVKKGRLTEFYLNDYLMQCYSLPELGTGQIGVIGPVDGFAELKAWNGQ